MYITSLIENDPLTLTPESTFDDVQEVFRGNDKKYAAVIDEGGLLIGIICRHEFSTVTPNEFSLKKLLIEKRLFDYYHILETIREFLKVEQEELPVTDEEGFYLGTCKIEKVQYHFNRTVGLIEGGSLIVIETQLQNYSLVDIGRIVESNQAKVLTHYISTHPDSNNIEITIVLNVSDINDITATFSRFDYDVVYTSTATERDDFLKERYDSFMHYLDI